MVISRLNGLYDQLFCDRMQPQKSIYQNYRLSEIYMTGKECYIRENNAGRGLMTQGVLTYPALYEKIFAI